MNKPTVSALTECCCVIGNPICHSLSPDIHNEAFKACGLDWIYVAHKVDDLESAIRGLRALRYRGISVTIPHKESALKFVDRLDETAKAIGAINTIVRTIHGELVGSNTDGHGALRALLDQAIDPADKRVLILGSGGAARGIAIAWAMELKPKLIQIEARNKEAGESLAKDIGRHCDSRFQETKDGDRRRTPSREDFDIIVQTTSVGMSPNTKGCLWNQEDFHAHQTVMDIIYTPRQTEFLQRAEARGCKAIDGLSMFLHQAALQFETWTKMKAPFSQMQAAAENALAKST